MKRKLHIPWNDFIPQSWDFVFKTYSWLLLKHDLVAGITVGLIALPLAMAFGIASGVSPEKGIITAIVAGFVTSLLGGSRLQIGGPTGAFIVIIFSIVQHSGYEGLVISTIIAGIILLISALARVGNLIKYIPYPLVTGFTTGIAIIIFSSQMNDFLGLKIQNLPADFIPKWAAILSSISHIDFPTFFVASGTLILIVITRKFFPIIPWGIFSVGVITIITWVFHIPVETIFSRFGAINREFSFPSFKLFSFASADWHMLFVDGITIAFLAGVESLLSAVVADGMAGTRHKANCELMAQGFSNLSSVAFGGIPATGAIARTATNIKMGGKTPMAGMIHAITLLLILLFLAPAVSMVPLAALSGVLVMVAWNMSEASHFIHLFKAPSGDVAVLLVTFFLTVLVDLTTAVGLGMILAAFLFIKRMGNISKVVPLSLFEKEEEKEEKETIVPEAKKLPEGIEVYEITGPFFFGIADSLKNVLANMKFPPKVFILRMRKVPVIDASGMHSLREFHASCKRSHTLLLLSEVSSSLLKSLMKFEVTEIIGETQMFVRFSSALKHAIQIKALDEIEKKSL